MEDGKETAGVAADAGDNAEVVSDAEAVEDGEDEASDNIDDATVTGDME